MTRRFTETSATEYLAWMPSVTRGLGNADHTLQSSDQRALSESVTDRQMLPGGNLVTGMLWAVLAAQGQLIRDCGGAFPHTGTLWRPSITCEDTFHSL